MLTYEVLDAVFKFTKDPVYYSLPAQVNQNAMRKTFKAWKGYFSAQKDWKKHPWKYKAKPRIPGYIRAEEATAWFTNQTAKLTEKENGEGCVLFFIDPGVNNFLATANNYGETPYLIRGGAIKSWNQWYNKKRSVFMKQLTKGKDSRHSIKDSRRLDALSRKRDDLQLFQG